MVPWLRVFSKDLSLFPNTHIEYSQPLVTPDVGDLMPPDLSSGLLRYGQKRDQLENNWEQGRSPKDRAVFLPSRLPPFFSPFYSSLFLCSWLSIYASYFYSLCHWVCARMLKLFLRCVWFICQCDGRWNCDFNAKLSGRDWGSDPLIAWVTCMNQELWQQVLEI